MKKLISALSVSAALMFFMGQAHADSGCGSYEAADGPDPGSAEFLDCLDREHF
ncbi:hypothetical protein [Pseudomonas sp. PA15(2017)]|uniref:hypothetical protein n=1 Tax=Pseudomonas sp. PA15(2017) TaxID=1932111 RepID=UPI00143A87D7|nr:hypothetical protein [Pseudomonas sp. PA15(2017)]